MAEVKEKGGLQGFIEALKLLEKRQAVKSIDIIIDNLPEGKRFSKLKDGITNRKYVICKITMVDGRENCLIEVEREDRALSMLILKTNILMNWQAICSIIIAGLVNESGKWSNDSSENVAKKGILVRGNKLIKSGLYNSV